MPERHANPDDITALLSAAGEGRGTAAEQLLALVYEELRILAGSYLAAERQSHTLQPTALVHEAYLELARLDRIRFQNRTHFFALAARAMRNVLADHAVAKRAAKRGGDRHPVPLDEVELASDGPSVDLFALRQALDRLEEIEPRQVRVLECRLFGGLSIDETAEALGISAATVSRDWTFARAWLSHQLAAGAGDRE
jgi:RNA polymerase sigma factor (TIGR02999 family)